jgi:acyl carrier protein
MSDKIINTLNKIFRGYFNNDKISLNNKTSSKNIKAWDSLAQISLIILIEKKFKIKFTVKEVESLSNVGEMINLINKKIH